MPRPVAAHRYSGQICPVPVAIEFVDASIQGLDCLGLHAGIDPPHVLAALRKDDDAGESLSMTADRSADADFGLEKSVLAPFAGAVKEEYDGPFLSSVPIRRDVHLVFVYIPARGY